MIENKVENLNDKKLSSLLFIIDYTHLEDHGEKIFGEEYLKEKRTPTPKIMGDIFDIIANDIDLDDEDDRLFIITELLAYLDIEILEKEKFIELNFLRMEEEYDKTIFSKKERKTIETIVEKYKKETPRQMANATFSIDKVRTTPVGEIII
jgi:hypothetical protein